MFEASAFRLVLLSYIKSALTIQYKALPIIYPFISIHIYVIGIEDFEDRSTLTGIISSYRGA
ncbi:hypothetical protein BJF93_10000 [Xaviernesmea oryzae]|uniref:Uncharacterized protein n=1 Tax=Xaviernesmea oryzae TaxID=464029 RepID=A0A1Q9AWT4_9HYPH|nr:hypothetical protein BJF93_10000 [Xaviernesmea oryzae]SEK44906.1 hypothetical protein SAMN04487976_102212 [Xaviernesmea oryzae]